MKKIPLTQGQFAIVDDDDFDFINQWKWFAYYDKDTDSYYAVRSIGPKRILMHREIMKTPKGLLVDHINHNTLDNRKKELRNVTSQQSAMNRKGHFSNPLGHKGVTKNGNSFRASVYKDGKYLFNKTFRNLEDAINAYEKASQTIQGEFRFRMEDNF